MTSKDWFGVVVRTIGLWTIFKAASQSLSVFTIMGGFFEGFSDSQISQRGRTIGAMMFIVFEFGVGFLLLRRADAVVSFAFPTRPSDSDSTAQ